MFTLSAMCDGSAPALPSVSRAWPEQRRGAPLPDRSQDSANSNHFRALPQDLSFLHMQTQSLSPFTASLTRKQEGAGMPGPTNAGKQSNGYSSPVAGRWPLPPTSHQTPPTGTNVAGSLCRRRRGRRWRGSRGDAGCARGRRGGFRVRA